MLAVITAGCGATRPLAPAPIRSGEHIRYGETRELDEMLARKEIDVNAVDTDGQTLLMQAAAAGRVAVAEVLLARGAVLEQTDTLGRTALLHACVAGKAKMVTTLVNLGANIAATSTDGRDCTAWADPTRSKETHISGSMMEAVKSALQTSALDPMLRTAMIRQAGERASAPPIGPDQEPDTEARPVAPTTDERPIGYGSFASVGVFRENVRSGYPLVVYFYQKPREGELLSRLQFNAGFSDATFSNTGNTVWVEVHGQVWRRLTVGAEIVQYKAYRDGASTGVAADEVTAGGPSLMLGWMLLQSHRFLVHAYGEVGSSSKATPDTSFGTRFGAGAFARVGLFDYPLGGLRATFSVQARFGVSSFSASAATAAGVDASYTQHQFSLTIAPFEFRL